MPIYCHCHENIHAAKLVNKCKSVLLSIPSPHIIMLTKYVFFGSGKITHRNYWSLYSTMDCTQPRVMICVNTKYEHGLARFNMVWNHPFASNLSGLQNPFCLGRHCSKFKIFIQNNFQNILTTCAEVRWANVENWESSQIWAKLHWLKTI